MIACPGCGQNLRFDPARQRLVCDYCDNTYAPQELNVGKTAKDENSEIAPGSAEAEFITGTLYTCTQCGGEILSDSDTAFTFCSYCGASVELEGRTVQMMAPSYIIPFKKSQEECKELYKGFIKKAVFAPDYMKEDAQLEKLRGIYMPYWTYEFGHNGPVSLDGKKSHRRGDYIITDYYKLDTDLSVYYNGTSFDASSNFPDVYSEAIAPYDITECRDFSSAYFSGFYADTADVEADIYTNRAREVVGNDVTADVINQSPLLRQHGVSSSDTNIAASLNVRSRKMAYFPVWFMSSRHNDKISYAVINGQTGKIAADIPIDYKKYIIGSLLLALPIAVVFSLLFTFTPSALTVFSIIFAVISLIISNSEMNRLYTRNNNLDDKGLASVTHTEPKAEAQPLTPTPEEISEMYKKDSQKKSSVSAFGTAMLVIGFMSFSISTELDSLIAPLISVALIIGGFIVSSLGKNASQKRPADTVTKQPLGQKWAVIGKPVAAIVFGVLLLLINPYQDYIYYGGVMIIMAFILISFYDIIDLHNQLTRRLPRQFNKRGGDE